MSKQIVERVIDRSEWPAGPWDKEPQNREQWSHNGFACLAIRNPSGAWCGYVGIPLDHPAANKHYDDIPVEVHGGLTYKNKCQGPICHIPEPGMPDEVIWLGFDCAHAWDLVPGMVARMRKLGISTYRETDTYRDIAYVKSQVNSLAEQLGAL